MPPALLLPDAPTRSDVLTFAGRAARLGDGSVRLRARSGILALTSAPLAPRGLLDATPTVLGMRLLAVDPELECDLVVDATRLAADALDERAVRLPDTAVTATWAGIAPPQTGWSVTGTISAAALASRAQWGIAAVADALPTDAGEEIVRQVRSEIWGASDDALGGIPRGAALAAFALGFVGGDEDAPVRACGPWTRITLQRGHVLTRVR